MRYLTCKIFTKVNIISYLDNLIIKSSKQVLNSLTADKGYYECLLSAELRIYLKNCVANVNKHFKDISLLCTFL